MTDSKKLLTLVGLIAVGVLSLTSVARAEDAAGSVSFWEKTKVTGSADVNYNANLNRPRVPGGTNAYCMFDANPNQFGIGLVELAIENSPNDMLTFRTDLDFGQDAGTVAAFENWGAGEVFNLQQAYVAVKAPVGTGLTFKAGKFVTMHGAEVIEAAGNYNISRGLLFNFAIPLTHTGLMANYAFADWITLDLGVVNGWNSVVDTNNGKSIHGQVTIKPIENVTWIIGGTWGPESPTGDSSTMRTLLDSTISYSPTEQWTFAVNYDLAHDTSVDPDFAAWQGVAAYINWKATDMFGLSVRGEYFRDPANFAGAAVASSKMYKGTITSHCYLTDGLDLRFEYRHDAGNANSFVKNDTTFRKFQDTVASQLVYSF